MIVYYDLFLFRPITQPSVLTPFLLNQNLPWGFLASLVEHVCSDADSFQRVCAPLIQGLSRSVRGCGLDSDHFQQPLMALVELLEIKLGSKRPICKLVRGPIKKRHQSHKN